MSLLLPQGHEIEEFRIETPLGVGGFGITYLAYDTKLERRVAIKEYMPEGFVAGRDPATQRPNFRGRGESADFHGFLDRFRAEALHIARFNHPNIVPIHRVLAHNGTAYIVMEYLGEISLQRLAASGPRLTEPELAVLLAGMLDGLSVMHGAGLLHRDVKPSNVMLRADGTPVLIDFGSVRRAHYGGGRPSVRVVSEGFSPPEQYDDDGRVGPWSDIFALAATCYFVMRGQPPAPVVERVLALMRKKPDPLVALSPAATGGRFSEQFLAAVSWGLELEESARPQSIREWAAMFPPPLCRRHFAAAGAPPAEAAAASGFAGGECESAQESPATLIADAAAPERRALRRRGRRSAAAMPSLKSERMRVLGQLAALGLVIVGATLGIGVATEEIGPPAAETASDRAAPAGDGAVEAKLAPQSARMPEPRPSVHAARCDALAAHPDDPGKPRGVPGVEFDAMSEAATREAVETCSAALGDDADNLRARFNLGRAFQRAAMLRPAERVEAWKRAGEAYAAAAAQGYAAAQGNLGQMLYGGTGGFPQDDRQAVGWLRKAAAGDFADAYLTLAHAYSTGRGVDQADQRKTYCWLTLLVRASSIRAYRSFAQQQRAAMLIGAADKRQIEESATRGADCL